MFTQNNSAQTAPMLTLEQRKELCLKNKNYREAIEVAKIYQQKGQSDTVKWLAHAMAFAPNGLNDIQQLVNLPEFLTPITKLEWAAFLFQDKYIPLLNILKNSVTELSLGSDFPSEAVNKHLARFIAESKILTTLDLNTSITAYDPLLADHMKFIAYGLKLNTSLKALILCDQHIGDEGLAILAQALVNSPNIQLEKLNLYGAGITAQGLAAFKEATKAHPINWIHTDIGDHTADVVKKIMKVFKKSDETEEIIPAQTEFKYSPNCDRFLKEAIFYLSKATPRLDTPVNIARIKQHIIIEKSTSQSLVPQHLISFMVVLSMLSERKNLLTQPNLNLLFQHVDDIMQIHRGLSALKYFFDGITQDHFNLLIKHAAKAGHIGEGMSILLDAKLNIDQYIDLLIKHAPYAEKIAAGIRALSKADPRLDTPQNIDLLIQQAQYADTIEKCLDHLRTIPKPGLDTYANFMKLIHTAPHTKKILWANIFLLLSPKVYGLSENDLQRGFDLCIQYAPQSKDEQDLLNKVKACIAQSKPGLFNQPPVSATQNNSSCLPLQTIPPMIHKV